jgi:hypothetical protein
VMGVEEVERMKRRKKQDDEEEKRRSKRERTIVVRGIGEVGRGGEVARRVLQARGVVTDQETVKGIGVKWGVGGAVVMIELNSREEVGRVMGRKTERLRGTRVFVDRDRSFEQRTKEREDRKRKRMMGQAGRGGMRQSGGWQRGGGEGGGWRGGREMGGGGGRVWGWQGGRQGRGVWQRRE